MFGRVTGDVLEAGSPGEGMAEAGDSPVGDNWREVSKSAVIRKKLNANAVIANPPQGKPFQATGVFALWRKRDHRIE